MTVLRCTKKVYYGPGVWRYCNAPAKWMVKVDGQEIPRCGNHAKQAKERRRLI